MEQLTSFVQCIFSSTKWTQRNLSLCYRVRVFVDRWPVLIMANGFFPWYCSRESFKHSAFGIFTTRAVFVCFLLTAPTTESDSALLSCYEFDNLFACFLLFSTIYARFPFRIRCNSLLLKSLVEKVDNKLENWKKT